MKTKEQKKAQIEKGLASIEGNRTMVFADFTGVKVNELNSFRKALAEAGARFSVCKKRLLRVAFEKKGIDLNPEDFKGQVGVVFSKEGIEALASVAAKFSREVKAFTILGGFDTDEKRFFPGEEVSMIGNLPPREILLAQVVGTIGAPISSLMYVLQERAGQVK